MPELGRFARELRSRFWKPTVADEVQTELREHIAMLAEDLEARGCSPDEAWAAARARFGNVERIGADCREQGERRDREAHRARWFAELSQDLRYAARQLRANPRFALVAITTLAIGLGASTTIFSIADAVLLRPLPFREPERLVLLDEVNPSGQLFPTSDANYLDWRAGATQYAELAAYSPRRLTLRGGSVPERVRGTAVTYTLFDVLGVSPELGRTFSAAEDRRGGDQRVVVIGDALWRGRFGADPDILQRSLDIDGVRHRVVGVMPRSFDFPGGQELWVPLGPDRGWERGDRRIGVVGRLARGATMQSASRELDAIAGRLAAEYPASNGSWTTRVHGISDLYLTPLLRERVTALLAAVALLVLMSCVNVASLLLARGGVRSREMTVRAALGAGRARLVRQLVAESLLLAFLGGLAGAALAAVAVPLIRSAGAAAAPLLATAGVDWRVLAFALTVCLLTGVVFGVAPALGVLRPTAGPLAGGALGDTLRSGSRVQGGNRVRRLLIVSSIALATVMLVGAVLVGTSFRRLMQTDLGFTPERVLTASLVLPEDEYDYGRSAAFFARLMPRLATIPGVSAAGAVNLAPFSGGNTRMDFVPGGTPPADPSAFRAASWRAVTPDYFRAIGIPLVRGRFFDRTDTPDAAGVVVINRAMARLGWPDGDPVGRQVTLSNTRVMTVIGIVGDSRDLAIDSVPAPAMYFAHAQLPWQAMWLTVRTAGDPMSVATAVQREVREVDPNLPLARVGPLMSLVRDDAAEPRLTMLVFGIFGAAALVLATVGLYGLMSYAVAQRTREIGVRVALGAAPGRVARMVIGQGLLTGLVGVALGLAAAAVLSRSLRGILYEVRPTDPVAFMAVALLLLAVAVLASAFPARRAARSDPMQALRSE